MIPLSAPEASQGDVSAAAPVRSKTATRCRAQGLLVAGLAAWLLTIGTGMGMLWKYADTPGPSADAKARWPAGASFTRDAGGPVLVLFLHPQCPCSRATISELARLLADAPAPAAIYALVYRPADADAGWERTDLWDSAAAQPGVHLMTDVGGAQARVFGAFISGQTLLYSATGSLLFSGGITDARGHEGDNPGRTALTSILAGGHPAALRTPVFGCYLYAESDVNASYPTDEEHP
jgi:hypothetical protein